MRNTKIVATLGPASDSPEMLDRLIAAGMDVARLNASHSSIAELDTRLHSLRDAAQRRGRYVAILLDLPGPKLRLGETPTRHLEAGSELTLTSPAGQTEGDARVDGANAVPCEGCGVLNAALSTGDVIVVGDGDLELIVTATSANWIQARVSVGGTIASRKGITVRDVSLPLPPVTERDAALLDWGIGAGVDLVALSYVRQAADVEALRERMGGADIPIIAKIERPEAVTDIDTIVDCADAVMVARGDLGVASAAERVPVYQRQIVSAARERGKPVIVATQMLESMITAPRPTRAEASDVANAVFESVDAVMLSAETAVGSYPVDSVATMARIIAIAEEYGADTSGPPRAHAAHDVPWAVSASIVELARRLDLAAIVTATESGATARFVAAHRPNTPIVAVTTEDGVARRLALVWGVTPIVSTRPATMDGLIDIACAAALAAGYGSGSLVAITAGVALNRPGSTDLIHVRRIG
jgi:pyruvate kinase